MSTEFYRNISLQDLLLNDGKSDNARYGVLLAKQHFLNYYQCNLETGRQEEAKYFRYMISDTWFCDLWYVNYKFLITVTVESIEAATVKFLWWNHL